MSSNPNRNSPNKADRNVAVDLEVPTQVADDIEAVLRSFAEEAEVDTSLVVDHSGYLIAGISSVPNVDVDSIGALVAGACGATNGLTGALGEHGRVESLHLGEDRLLYLKEVGERFILVGVSDSAVPAGILRDQADRIEKPLVKFLSRVKVMPKSLTRERPASEPVSDQPAAQSLRQPEPKKMAKSVVVKTKTRLAAAQNDSVPASVFEISESDMVDEEADLDSPELSDAPIEAKRPSAVVENSPFEVDFEDDVESAAVRPPTQPVHLSVPAARARDAEARKNQEDGDSGPRYTFELG